MADTSPDTANTDRLVVAVRYVNEENQPKERVLEMKETKDKSGEGQAKEVLQSLNSKIGSQDGLVYHCVHDREIQRSPKMLANISS